MSDAPSASGESPSDGGVAASSDEIVLSDDEGAAVADAARAFAAALPTGPDQPYLALADAAEDGRVPADQVPDLERVCALALETGKARQIGRAEAERFLTAVYTRTPAGQAQRGEVAAVNRALAGLDGRALRSARLTWRTPGRYGLALSVEGVDLTLDIGPDGLTVKTLQAG